MTGINVVTFETPSTICILAKGKIIITIILADLTR